MSEINDNELITDAQQLAFNVIYDHKVLKTACQFAVLVERKRMMIYQGEDGSVLDKEIDRASAGFFSTWSAHTSGVNLTNK